MTNQTYTVNSTGGRKSVTKLGIQAICDMYRAGYTNQQVADKVDVTVGTVLYWIDVCGVARKRGNIHMPTHLARKGIYGNLLVTKQDGKWKAKFQAAHKEIQQLKKIVNKRIDQSRGSMI